MTRELLIRVQVLEAPGVPIEETLGDTERALRTSLENVGFDVGAVSVEMRPGAEPERRA